MKVIETGICRICVMARAGPVTPLKAIARWQSLLIPILNVDRKTDSSLPIDWINVKDV